MIVDACLMAKKRAAPKDGPHCFRDGVSILNYGNFPIISSISPTENPLKV